MAQQQRNNKSVLLKLTGMICSIFVIAMFAASCKPAADSEPTTIPTQTQAIAPTATEAIAVELNLIAFEPAAESMIPLNQDFTFYFNLPMNTQATEAAFQIEPDIPGQFNWLNEQTLQFSPDQALNPDQYYIFSISADAQAQGGATLTEPFSTVFQTVTNLQATQFFPQDNAIDVDTRAAVWVAFNQPIVPETDLDLDPSELPQGFILDPAAPGVGKWANPSTYIFYPASHLIGGKSYEVEINKQLTSLYGAPISTPTSSFQFTTRPPELMTIDPPSGSYLTPNSDIHLEFNQPMNTASVESALNLRDGSGNTVPIQLDWNEDETIVQVTPTDEFPRGNEFLLSLQNTAKTKSGIILPNVYQSVYSTYPSLKLIQEASRDLPVAYNGYATLTYGFNIALDETQNFISMIDIQPAVADLTTDFNPDTNQLNISGFFRPASTYYISIAPDISDRWGKPLGEVIYHRINTGRAPVTLNVNGLDDTSPILFVPAQDIALPAETVNLRRLIFTRMDLSAEQFIELSEADKITRLTYPISNKTEWSQVISPYLVNTIIPTEISLAPRGYDLDTGLYYYLLTSPEYDENYLPTPFLAVVANTHLTMKRSGSQVMVWAIDFQTLEPIQGAPVILFDDTGEVLDANTTDARGIAHIDLTNIPQTAQLFTMMNQPGHAQFGFAASTWSDEVQPEDFGFTANLSDSGFVSGYIFTDRPNYAPGQRIHFKAYLDSASIVSLPDTVTADFAFLLGDESITLSSDDYSVDAYGAIRGTFTVPETLLEGRYQIRLPEFGTETIFHVSAADDTGFELKPALDHADWPYGSELTGTISALYDFGAGISSQPIQWQLFAQEAAVDSIDAMSYGLHPNGLETQSSFQPTRGVLLAEGDCLSDRSGACKIQVAEDAYSSLLEPSKTYQLILAAQTDVWSDNEELTIRSSAAARLQPGKISIGVQAESWGTQAGDEIGFSIRSIDWHQQIAPNEQLTASFQQITWRQDTSVVNGKEYTYLAEEFTQIGSSDFHTNDEGLARLIFTPPTPGIYRLLVQNEQSSTDQWLWIAGDTPTTWQEFPGQRLTIHADQPQYQPGDTARIFIPNPFSGLAQALISIESNGFQRDQLITIDSGAYLLDLPIKQSDAPGIYVNLTLIAADDGSLPDYRTSYLFVPVIDENRKLYIEADASYEPTTSGVNAQISISTNAADGTPLPADLSLILLPRDWMDRSLNPFFSSYEQMRAASQTPGVENAMGLTHYTRIPNLINPEQLSRLPQLQPIPFSTMPVLNAGEYRWLDSIQTDETGETQVNLFIPDTYQDWVIYLVGKSAETSIAQQTLPFSPVELVDLRLHAPHSASAGDLVYLEAVLENHSTESITSSLSLTGSNFTLIPETASMQEVTLTPESSITTRWQLTVGDGSKTVFQVEASSGSKLLSSVSREMNVYANLAPVIYSNGYLESPAQDRRFLSLPPDPSISSAVWNIHLYPSLTAFLQSQSMRYDALPAGLTEPSISRLLIDHALLKNDPERQTSFEKHLANIMRAQHADGSFGFTQSTPGDPFLTAYALIALQQANDAGYETAAPPINRAVTYLEQIISADTATLSQADNLWVLYALRNSKADLEIPDELLNAQPNSPFEKALLAAILSKSDPEQSKSWVDEIIASPQATQTGKYWYQAAANPLSDSASFQTAFILNTLITLHPDAPVIDDAVEFLIDARTADGWGAPFEAAWIIHSLSEYLQIHPAPLPDYPLKVEWNHELVYQENTADAPSTDTLLELPIDGTASTPNLLQITRGEGVGNLIYDIQSVTPTGSPISQPITGPISISRTYEIRDLLCRVGDCQTISEITQSDQALITVRLQLSISQPLDHLWINEFIPGGAKWITAESVLSLQPINAQNPLQHGIQADHFTFLPQNNQQIAWYAESVPAGTYELIYFLRPTTAGNFTVPAPLAFTQYDHRIKAIGEISIFNILPADPE
ncbi:MAG: Ig-like domain-containing protein [Anaerolineaceae bacterium]|nr:Ig-like domain-containing protein [Anaerolineaceae bacterium]